LNAWCCGLIGEGYANGQITGILDVGLETVEPRPRRDQEKAEIIFGSGHGGLIKV
jgi:hypothetical protein